MGAANNLAKTFDEKKAMRMPRSMAVVAEYAARAAMWRKLWCTEHVLLSFPKCGRTWLRHVLAVFQDESAGPGLDLTLSSGKSLHKTVVTHGGTDFVGMRGYLGRSKLERNVRQLAGKNVLFLIRDPRDVVVSFYYEATLRHRRGVSDSCSMSEFIRHEGFGVRYVVDFLSLVHQHRKLFGSYLLLRYEDLRADPVAGFGRAVRFLMREPTEGPEFDRRLRAAIEASAFDVMKKREAANEYATDSLRPGDPLNPDSYKVRRGVVGGYRQSLSPEDCRYLDEHIKGLPEEFGYG